MLEILTMQGLTNGHLDVKALEEVVNGNETKQVTTRLGESYPSVKKAIKTLFENGGLPATPFATKALMTASVLVDGKYAMVTDDTVNNGLYVKTAGVWVKSKYDPLSQSLEQLVKKVNYSDIGYEYIDGNIAKVKSITHTNRALNINNSLVYNGSYTSRGMAVSAGDELYLYPINDSGTLTRFALFSDSEATTEQLVSYQGEKRTDPESKKNYTYLLVPDGATYLVFNVTDENSDEWAIYDTRFSDDLTPAKKVAVSIESIPLRDLEGLNIDDVVTKRSLSADLVSARNILTNRNITAPKTITYTPTNSQWVLRLRVQAGEVYYARIVAEKIASGQFTDGFRSFYGKYYEDFTNPENFTQNIDFQATDKENIYRFTVPDVEGVSVVYISSSRLKPADMLEGLEPFSIQRNYFDDSLVGVEQDGVEEVAGMPVIDSYARALANVRPHPVQNRLSDKKVWAFGSSTTAGTRGGFLKYLDRAFNTNVVNKGSSGAQIGRLVNSLIAKTGLNEYPGTSFDFPLLDFTNLSCVILMVGTNDSVFNTSGWGTVDDLPTSSVYEYANTDDYWNTQFNDTFISKMGYFIEYVKWKAPLAEIHVIQPIRVNQGDTYDRMNEVLDAIAVVAKSYSVHLINAADESGLSYKDMAVGGVYSYDGLHLNETGNQVLGNFIAQKVLSYG